MYRYFLQPLFFLLDAEKAHYAVFNLLKILFRIPLVASVFRKSYHFSHPKLEREVFGIRFPNPVGLAAGFDKNGVLVRELADLGFGFIEIGTITPLPQAGNPKPRLFRLKPDKALINRMGFNNDGAVAVAQRLRRIQNSEFRIQNLPSGLRVAGVVDLHTLGQQPPAALLPATGKDRTTILCLHARTETELTFASALGGLIGAFHRPCGKWVFFGKEGED